MYEVLALYWTFTCPYWTNIQSSKVSRNRALDVTDNNMPLQFCMYKIILIFIISPLKKRLNEPI